MAGEEVAVQISDVEDVRQVLAACLTFFQAEDLKTAQVQFSAVRPSPLSLEVERLTSRFRGYLGDYYLAQREAELEDEDAEQEAPNTSGNVQDESEEVLSDSPLGEFQPPRQAGQRLTDEEVAAEYGDYDDEPEDEPEPEEE